MMMVHQFAEHLLTGGLSDETKITADSPDRSWGQSQTSGPSGNYVMISTLKSSDIDILAWIIVSNLRS